MPQINLLKENRGADATTWRTALSIANKVLMVALALLLAYYGWLIYSTKHMASQEAEVRLQISNIRSAALKSPDRQELITRQGQLKAASEIVARHPYWSYILPSLASVMLKGSSSLTFRAEETGTLGMEVHVKSIEDLDRLLQIFDLPQYNRYFNSVRIGSIGNDRANQAIGTRVDMKMNYNPELLKYSPDNSH